MTSKPEELEQLQGKHDKVCQELEATKGQLLESQKERDEVKSELHDVREELERTQSQMDEILGELEQTHFELHQLKEKGEVKQVESGGELGKELEETKAKLEQSQLDLGNVREELEKTQSQLDEVLGELEQTHLELHQLKEKGEQSQSDGAVKKELEETKAKLRETEELLEKSQSQLGETMGVLEDYQSQLQATMEALEQYQPQLKQQKQEAERINQEWETTKSQLKQKDAELANFKTKIQTKQQELQQKTSTINQTKTQLKNAEAELAKLQGQQTENAVNQLVNVIRDTVEQKLLQLPNLLSSSSVVNTIPKKKIPCFVFIYHQIDFIKQTLDFLLDYTEEIEIYIVENKSINTEKIIRPYISNLVNSGQVKKYFLFETNITNNAMEMVLESPEVNLNNSEYVLLTDADLVPNNKDWLQEEISILRNNFEVFCCGINLDLSNLPVDVIPKAVNWYPPAKATYDDYIEGVTGHHFVLMRTGELKSFLDYMHKSNLKYRDSEMHRYCYHVLNKKWARTKQTQARHLKWDVVKVSAHPYLQRKQLVKDIWNHNFYCSYEVYGRDYYAKQETPQALKSGKVFDEDPEPSNSFPFKPPYKLHIGSGPVKLPGWVNIDMTVEPGITDLKLDISKGLPFEDNSCALIYHEHCLEHLPVKEGVEFLKECHRVLKKGGVTRISTPSLDVILQKCHEGNWRDQHWLQSSRYRSIQTKAEMLNAVFRWWGHQWVYDREELHRRLREAGFTQIKDVEWGMSEVEELRNRETRKDSLLICEAYKS